MPGSTPIYNLPFQEIGDPPHGPDLGSNLADAVEDELARIDSDVAAAVNSIMATINANRIFPIVKLVQQSAQTINDSVDTAITFGTGSEEFDTHNFHNTGSNTSRITPNVAGYYMVGGIVMFAANASTTLREAQLRKNGGLVATPVRQAWAPGSNVSNSAGPNIRIMTANGSTDYFELYGRHQQTGGGTSKQTSVDGSFSSSFWCFFLRPL